MFIKKLIANRINNTNTNKKYSRLTSIVLIIFGIVLFIGAEYSKDIRIALFKYRVNSKYYNEQQDSTEVLLLIEELPVDTLKSYLLQTNDIIVIDYAIQNRRQDFIQSLGDIIENNEKKKNDLFFCSIAAQIFIQHPECFKITSKEKHIYEPDKLIRARYLHFTKWLKYFSIKYPSVPTIEVAEILFKPVKSLEKSLQSYKSSKQKYEMCKYIIEYAKLKKINTENPLWGKNTA